MHTRTLNAFADETFDELYFDGVNQGPSEGWGSMVNTGPIVIPPNTRVIAAKVTNLQQAAGLIAESTDGSIISDASTWKTSPVVGDVSTWMLSGYEVNLNSYHNVYPTISHSSQWLWDTSGTAEENYSLYFRMILHNKCTYFIAPAAYFSSFTE